MGAASSGVIDWCVRVLGIDPGLRLTGYACLDSLGPIGPGMRPTIVEAGVIRLVGAAGERRSISDRLAELDTDFRAILERVEPRIVAVEGLFAHYKHPATAIAMGHARGVLLLAIRQRGLELVEMKPKAVKRSLTGSGSATKEQMQLAVQTVFGLAAPPKPHDVADALAIALCASERARVDGGPRLGRGA